MFGCSYNSGSDTSQCRYKWTTTPAKRGMHHTSIHKLCYVICYLLHTQADDLMSAAAAEAILAALHGRESTSSQMKTVIFVTWAAIYTELR